MSRTFMTGKAKWIVALAGAALLAAPIRAGASAVGAKPFQFGVKGGVSIADLKSESFQDTSSITGLTGGIWLSIGGGSIAFAPELLLTAKGFKYTGAIGSTALSVVNKYNYIDLPLLIKFVVAPASPIRPYVAFGPAVSFLMSAESRSTLAGATTTTDVKSALKNYEYSAVADVGVAIFVGIGTITADLRYAFSVVDTSDTVGVSTKNSVISILAGFGF